MNNYFDKCPQDLLLVLFSKVSDATSIINLIEINEPHRDIIIKSVKRLTSNKMIYITASFYNFVDLEEADDEILFNILDENEEFQFYPKLRHGNYNVVNYKESPYGPIQLFEKLYKVYGLRFGEITIRMIYKYEHYCHAYILDHNIFTIANIKQIRGYTSDSEGGNYNLMYKEVIKRIRSIIPLGMYTDVYHPYLGDKLEFLRAVYERDDQSVDAYIINKELEDFLMSSFDKIVKVICDIGIVGADSLNILIDDYLSRSTKHDYTTNDTLWIGDNKLADFLNVSNETILRYMDRDLIVEKILHILHPVKHYGLNEIIKMRLLHNT